MTEEDLWDAYDLDAFLRGYEECAEFCTEGDEYLAEGVGWHKDLMDEFASDCADFARDNVSDLVASGLDAYRAGMDFWLTRERHGAGYWDKGYGESDEVNEALSRLTNAAHAYGAVDLYVDDEGWIRS